MKRVSDVLKDAGIKIPGITTFNDRMFQMTCVSCKKSQTLDQSNVSSVHNHTYYSCDCGNDLAIVYKFGSYISFEGHAYRLKDYVIKSSSDLFIMLPNGSIIQFPSS